MIIWKDDIMPLFKANELLVRGVVKTFDGEEKEERLHKLANVWNALINVNNSIGNYSVGEIRDISYTDCIDDVSPKHERMMYRLMHEANGEDVTVEEQERITNMLHVYIEEVMERIIDDCAVDSFEPRAFFNHEYNNNTEMQEIVGDITNDEMINFCDEDEIDYLIHNTDKVNEYISCFGWDSTSCNKSIMDAVRGAIQDEIWQVCADRYNDGALYYALDYYRKTQGELISVGTLTDIMEGIGYIEPCTTLGEVKTIVDVADGDMTVEDFVKINGNGNEYIIIEMESSRLINSYNSLEDIPNIIRKMEVKAVSGGCTYEILI